ncbi:hypothetical protein [Lentisphaera araneosa]|nr:hypothetical protein [Lentisphaera araneosa]
MSPLFGEIEYSEKLLSMENKLYIAQFKNKLDKTQFLPPSQIKSKYLESFQFDYDLCRSLYHLKKLTLESRLKYMGEVESEAGRIYAEAMTGNDNESNLRELIMTTRLELKGVEQQLEFLELYKEKYLLAPKKQLNLVFRKN